MEVKKREKAIKKVTIVGAIVNFILSIFKIIIGLIGNSSALIADGIHSLSDLISDGFIIYIAKYSSDAPDQEHPYGHERFETVATLGLAVFLTIIGISIIFDAINRIFHNEALSHSFLLLSVSIISILANEALYWYTIKTAKKCKSSMLKANAWHHRSDALSSIIVFIGILGSVSGYIYLDSISAIIVGLIIIYVAWKLGFKAIIELVDTSIDKKQILTLKKTIKQINGVKNLHSLRTRKNANKIICDVHVQVDPFLSVSEGHIISISVERTAKKCMDDLIDVTVHIDPEDDEIDSLYENLPERSQALKIIDKKITGIDYYNYINNIRLHYLEGKIYIDFYLSLDSIKLNKSTSEILAIFKDKLCEVDYFGEIKLYFE